MDIKQSEKSNDQSSYYEIQGAARGISDRQEVERQARSLMSETYSRVILPFLPENRKGAIYEAATGPGIIQVWLRDKGYSNVYGSDFAVKEAELAKEINPNIEHGDSVVGVTARGDEQYDAIIALDFLEHIPRESVLVFLKNSRGALKPGGVLIMRAPNADSPLVGLNLYNDITHVWAYTTVSLRAMSRICSFSSISFDDDTTSSIQRYRWIKCPVMKVAQWILRHLLNIACRTRVTHLGSSIYIYAKR